jgi:hydroxymethylglutaryl-CoA synthase
MDVGLEGLAVHLPRHFLDLGTLARANGVDPAKYYFGLGGRRMAVPEPHEDPVVLAAEAARRLLDAFEVDPARIGLVVVGTESGVDGAKPIAAYVHRLAGLPADCRSYDIQHACYGGTAALRTALDWVASGNRPGRKALVVATDVARYDIGSPGEPTQGAGAVAVLVGDEPRVLRIEPYPEAVHTEEVADFWRPTYRSTALADGHYSMDCYLRAAEACWGRFRLGSGLGLADFDFLLFHAPFPKLAFKAHRRLFALARADGALPHDLRPDLDYERRVLPGLWANAEVGNAYSASLFLSLAGLLEHQQVAVEGRRVGLFSYGSGSCAEFLAARIGPDAAAWRERTGLHELLHRRRELDHAGYLEFRRQAEALAHDGSCQSPAADAPTSFCGTTGHRRLYHDTRRPLSIPPALPESTADEGSGSPA